MYVQTKDQTNEPKDRLSCVCVPLTPLLNGLFHFETHLVIISISSIRLGIEGYIKWKERFVFSGTGSPGMEYINHKKRSVYPLPTRERRYWFGTTPNKQPDLRAAPSCAPPDPPPPSTRSRNGMYLLNKRMCTVDRKRKMESLFLASLTCLFYELTTPLGNIP